MRLTLLLLFVGAWVSIMLVVVGQPIRVKFKEVVRGGPGTFNIVEANDTTTAQQDARILLAVSVKNHQHSLPTFLATLETLKCPNQNKKCDLWIAFDDCSDKSYDIFTNWLSSKRPLFVSILMIDTKNDEKTRQNHPELSDAYFSRNLKIRALAFALDQKFDYIFFIKADVVITNPATIEILMSKKKSIVAPLLTSTDTHRSTFWHDGPTEQEFDKLYMPIYQRTSIGCFKVFGVQDCYMLDLHDNRFQDFLLQAPNAESDFHMSAMARAKNILMHVCNRETFGYTPDSIPDREASFTHLRIEHLLRGPNKTYNLPLPVSQHIDYSTYSDAKKTMKSRLGFDEIYVINLARRPDRRERIEETLEEMGVDFRIFEAVDGTSIDEAFLKKLGIKSLPDYKDPYSGRQMNYGEIGCFLSHYFIWKDIVEKKHKQVIILEDDARFVLNFKNILTDLLQKVNEKHVAWDLMYLGRKQMDKYTSQEYWENAVNTINGYGIVHPAYSHWTISYALTLEGAQKLTRTEPLKRLLPVDEYLPLMFDKQPNEYWSSFYPVRDVKALSIYPSIVMPTHFVGEPSYISDTEHTPIYKEQPNLDAASDENMDDIDEQSIDQLKSRIEL